MARVYTVKKARKDQGKCEKCGTELPAGSAYKYCAPRAHRAARGRLRKRCMDCPNWRPSETTSSSALASLYGAQEAADDALGVGEFEDAEELKTVLTDLAEGVREAAETYRESASNIEDGFGHSTYQSDELNEKADTLDSAADDLENVDVEDFDEDAARKEVLDELDLWRVDVGDVLQQVYDSEQEAREAGEAMIAEGVENVKVSEVEEPDDLEDGDLPDSVDVEELVAERKAEWLEEAISTVQEAVSGVEAP